MLKDQVENGLRSTQRVEILLTLLCDHDEIKGDPNSTPNAFILQQPDSSNCISYPTLDRWIPTNCEGTSSLDAADSGEQCTVVHEDQLGHQGGIKL